MKLNKFIGILALIIVFGATAYAQTADDILAKAIDAQGGAAKFKALNSIKSTGKVIVAAAGLEMAFVQYQKRPNKMRTESDMMGQKIVQATNGTVAWMINPMTGSTAPTAMPDLQAKITNRQADFDGFYFNREKRGIKAEYIGKETINDEELHNIKITYDDGFSLNAYFDPASSLLRMIMFSIDSEYGEIQVQSYFSDYREVNGMIQPFIVEQNVGPQSVRVEIESYEYNTPVDDSLFEMPEAETEG